MLLHTTHSLNRNSGGVAVAVISLLQHLAPLMERYEVNLLAQPGKVPLIASSRISKNCVWYPLDEKKLAKSIKGTLNPLFKRKNVQLIHDHGIWKENNRCVAKLSRHWQVPRIVSPHGMLEPWAWEYKIWKKKIAWKLYQHRDLATATVLHTTSKQEAEALKPFIPDIPTTIIPLGIDAVPKEILRLEKKKGREVKQALFLSRLHQKKGLDNLLDAWHDLHLEDWKLLIAGPDKYGYRQILEKKIKSLSIKSVAFLGEVHGAKKWELYRQADLFILPSHSENFGIVIGEALAAGTPVITTQATPWQDLETYNCGWWIADNKLALREVLLEATQMSDLTRCEMGLRGQNLIQNHFTWKVVAEKMADLYCSILHGGQYPSFI